MGKLVLPDMGNDWIEGCVDQYIILSLSHSTREFAMFWNGDETNYTATPINAGRFTGDQVRANIDRYNDGLSSVAVPLTRTGLGLLGLYPTGFAYNSIDAFLTIDKIAETQE